MSPKTMSTVTGSRRLVACDHCGKEYEQRKFKEHTKRVNLGCPHQERLAKGQGKLVCLISYVLCLLSYVLCLLSYALCLMSIRPILQS